MSNISSQLGEVTHKANECSLNKVQPELRKSIGTMISYIVNNTWVKIKILLLNWEVWNTRHKSPCETFAKETKIPAGIQLELF